MSFFHFSAIAAILPTLIKKAMPFAAKHLKLAEIDSSTQEKVKSLSYPRYYAALYGMWLTVFLGAAFVAACFIAIYGPKVFPGKSFILFLWLAMGNFIGVMALGGGLLCALFWRISSRHFRDYVRLRLIKSGGGYVVEHQIHLLIKIGIAYYLLLAPLIIFLLK